MKNKSNITNAYLNYSTKKEKRLYLPLFTLPAGPLGVPWWLRLGKGPFSLVLGVVFIIDVSGGGKLGWTIGRRGPSRETGTSGAAMEGQGEELQ